MKLRKKTKLLLVLFVVLSIAPLFTNALADEEDTTPTVTVDTNWVDVSLTSWNGHDITYNSGTSYDKILKFHKGGYGISNVIDHGRIAFDEDTQTGIYETTMDTSFYALAYTNALVADCATYRVVDERECYLRLLTFTSGCFGGCPAIDWSDTETQLRNQGFDGANKDTYDARWNSMATTNFYPNDYNGLLGIKLEVGDTLPNGAKPGDTVSLLGVNYKLNNYTIIIQNVVVTDIQITTFGDYNTNYAIDKLSGTDEEEINSGYNDPYSGKSGIASSCSDAQEEVDDRLSELGIHDLTRVPDVTENIWHTYSGQSKVIGGAVGQIYGRRDDLNNATDIYEFVHPLEIKPEFTQTVNNFNVIKADLYVDRTQDKVSPAGIKRDSGDEPIPRVQVLGFHVVNYVVKVQFTAGIKIRANIAIEGKVTTGVLEDPTGKFGDTLYNNYMAEDKANIKIEDPWGDIWAGIEDWWSDWLDSLGMGDWWDNLLGWLGDYQWIWVVIGIAIVLTITIVIYKKIRGRKGGSGGGSGSHASSQTVNVSIGKTDNPKTNGGDVKNAK